MEAICFNGIHPKDINCEGIIEGLRYGSGTEYDFALNKFAGMIYAHVADFVSSTEGDSLSTVVIEDKNRRNLLSVCQNREDCLRVIAYDVALNICSKPIKPSHTIDDLVAGAKEAVARIFNGRYRVFYDEPSSLDMPLDENVCDKSGLEGNVPEQANNSLREERVQRKKEFHHIRKAIVLAIKTLKKESKECFDYLGAVIESHFLARERQRCRPKPKSKRTREINNPIGELFLRVWGGPHSASSITFIDPFEKIGLGGSRKRKLRHDRKVKLVKIFALILKAEVEKIADRITGSFGNFIGNICKWLGEDIRYNKRNYNGSVV